ncbi:MAG: TetR family transcriptional regulator [Methylobacterium brachiatum]|jgi:TetR/AcrR family transcriptional repressor of nem operon|nr:TetR family transcriptional regulator [Methylobacterium brachiatum]
MMAIMIGVKQTLSQRREIAHMKVSREQMGENRRRILDAAGRLFRDRGFEAVTVAEVMREAGLTHGGFYGHFRSKDDLIAAALAELVVASEPGPLALPAFAARYLSPAHRDDPARGCPVAALASDTIRQAPEARAAMTEGLRRQIARLTDGAAEPESARQAAIGSWAAMVGAMILARMSDDPALSDEVLAQTRAWIDRASPSTPAE